MKNTENNDKSNLDFHFKCTDKVLEGREDKRGYCTRHSEPPRTPYDSTCCWHDTKFPYSRNTPCLYCKHFTADPDEARRMRNSDIVNHFLLTFFS